MIYVGTDLKFAIKIECEGFNMLDDNFHIELKNGRRKITVDKGNMIYDDKEDTWYLCFDSTELGAGDITMVVYAEVPDQDFIDQDFIRTEVYKCTLCHIENV